VSTLGVTRSATFVSYCWSEHLAGGSDVGRCADGNLGHPAHALRWRPGARVGVDLRLLAHDVQIQAVRIAGRPGRPGRRPGQVVRLHAVRVDSVGRRWAVRLPQRASNDTDLLISAQFAAGDVEADLGLRRA
jgi:hypothetical protein